MDQLETARRQTIEYKFLRQNTYHSVPKMRYSVSAYLIFFQVLFIGFFGYFASYSTPLTNGHKGEDTKIYASKNYSIFSPNFLLSEINPLLNMTVSKCFKFF
jgi:hypothetical protein